MPPPFRSEEVLTMNVMSVSAASPTGDSPAAVTLNFSQAISVWLLHWAGEKDHQIAAKLGTNAFRVEAVLSERYFVGSRERAARLIPKG